MRSFFCYLNNIIVLILFYIRLLKYGISCWGNTRMSHAVQLKRRQLSFTCIWINLQLSFKTVLQICNILKLISLPGMSDALKKLLNSLKSLVDGNLLYVYIYFYCNDGRVVDDKSQVKRIIYMNRCSNLC